MHGLTIDRLAVEDPCWGKLVESSAGATPFHHPAIVNAVADGMGREAQGWGVRQDGELVGGLVILSSRRAWLTPVSAAAYNGPILIPSSSKSASSRDRHSSAVVSALCGAVRANHARVELRMVPGTADVRELIAAGWALRPSFTNRIDIADLPRALSAIDSNRRRLIRRAETLGYTVGEIGEAIIGESDRLQVASDRIEPSDLATICRLHRVQQQGYRQPPDLDLDGWRRLLGRLLGGSAARLFVARCPQGELVAFQLVTSQRGIAANLLTGACPEHLASGANGLLRWRVCEVLHGEGVRQLDLNGARPGPSGRFKASFGGNLVERWELHFPGRTTPRSLPQQLIRRLSRLVRYATPSKAIS